jgi:gluconolactonase
VWHAGPFNFANGIALDSSEKYLYVVSSFLPGIERIAVGATGEAGEREVYATLPEAVPDGLAFDNEGNLYVSCYAPNKIYKISPDSSVSVLIEDWEAHTLSNPTNIAFGGKELKDLFVSNLGRWHISRIDLGIEGLKLACHHV